MAQKSLTPAGFIMLTTTIETRQRRFAVRHIVSYQAHPAGYGGQPCTQVQDSSDRNGHRGYGCTLVDETPDQIDALICEALGDTVDPVGYLEDMAHNVRAILDRMVQG